MLAVAFVLLVKVRSDQGLSRLCVHARVRATTMHAERLWRASVSEPSKGRGATVRSGRSSGGGSSIATVRASACERESVCERWRVKERQTRQDSREKRREPGSEPSLSSPLQEKRETRTLQPGAVGALDPLGGGGGISVPFCRRASA